MSNSRSSLPVIAISFFASGIAVAHATAHGIPGIDDVTPISESTEDYIGRTTLFDTTEPDFTLIASLTAGNCTLTFSPAVEVRTASTSWSSWGPPPNPRVFYSQSATSIEMTLNRDCAAGTFGFEAQPDAFVVHLMTATYYGDKPLGGITRPVDGSAGPRLFAADSDTPIVSAVFSSTAAFAVGRIRFALPSDAILFGYVTDKGGIAIPGARVTAEGGDPVTTRSRVTDADGSYSMSLPHGTYDVTAEALGYQSQTMPGVTVSGKAPTEVDFALDVLP
jgi:hypothetical protein